MWRRLYLLLVPLRLYFALSPSYIHPDEHFQGPEIIAGEIFGWPSHRTWEFTSTEPIRSIFPLWLIYGLPLTLVKWIWEGLGYTHSSELPTTAFYALRILMFLLSFILEDWAVDELVPNKDERRVAIFFVTSSYVTWTLQTRTLSNSIETLIVLWCLVLMRRIRENKDRTQPSACFALAFLGALGIFNRITFPAFLVIPAAQLLPHLLQRPRRLVVIGSTVLVTALYAVALDTDFYSTEIFHLRQLPQNFVFTPWNNVRYNLDPSNLAKHGLHPFWQHFLANLPQLLGPGLLLAIFSSRRNSLFWSAIVGVAILSCFQHQEPRFLLPAVPLLLSTIRLPKKFNRTWLAAWAIFNVLAGILFGVYHQGGVIPAQTWIASQEDVSSVLWWKTYSPPRWLLDGKNDNITTIDLMGMQGVRLEAELARAATTSFGADRTLLVAPYSAVYLDKLSHSNAGLHLTELWQYRNHVGLDDLDFGDDGIWPTLQRVVGRRGLIIWEVHQ
ncbi:hypothetical protein AMS68_004305 [Peltaster fructicola]|uniref:Mannosyltransferase n=1 Tax=Peltaster fructicola TaxID=286661 RepID=A0A6H0XW13_9PEZI|nr:hypothetical protein AMS68_004305 [Peltaster fructicola]